MCGDIDRFSEWIARHQHHALKIVSVHVQAERVPEVPDGVLVRAYAGLHAQLQQPWRMTCEYVRQA
ncbi:MAG: hypothetical protein NTNFB01_17530 [Nitrospira sp.]